MINPPQPDDILSMDEGKRKLPEMLNVLTILTFVGCGIGLIFSVIGFFNAQKTYDSTVETMGKMENAPEFAKKLLGPDPVEAARRTLDNNLPITLLALVSYGLCFFGALQMRSRKKSGFSIYTIGELLPIVSTAIFIGLGLLSTIAVGATFLITFVFIILYATQLKHLS